MLRRIGELFQRGTAGLRAGLRDLWHSLSFRHPGGLGAGLVAALREIGRVLVVLASSLDPRNLRTVVSRDSRSIAAGSHMLAATTTSTIGNVLWMVLTSPYHLVRGLFAAPPRFWRFLRTRTPMQLVAGTALAVVGVAAAGLPTLSIVRERRIENLRQVQYRLLDENLQSGNREGSRHNLTVLLAKSPGDPKLTARLAALDAGEAEAGDFKLARMLMRHHRTHGDVPASAREAGKYLAHRPNDYEALTISAEEAVRRGDRARAATLVARMPPPQDASDTIPPWECGAASRLFRELNDTERLDDLVNYVAERYVPVLRSSFLTNLEPGSRIWFVDLYNLALTQLEQRPQLKGYWVPAQEVCHAIANAPSVRPTVLGELGTIQEAQLSVHLRRMAQLRLISADEHRQFAAEIEDRLTRIWQRLRSIDAKNPLGYIGLAMQRARAGSLSEGVSIIEEGLEVCGPKALALVEKKAELLRMIDPARGLAFLDEALEGADVPPGMYRIVALEAIAARRPDKALEAIAKAKALAPNLEWIGLEADVLMQAGRPAEAAQVLGRAGAAVARDSSACALYVRALVESGSAARAVEFLNSSAAGDHTQAALLSGVDALVRSGQRDPAVAVLREIVRKDPLNVHAQVVLGDCLREQAEQAIGPGWDRRLVADALKAYEVARARFPNNLRVVNNVAWLELIALDLVPQAFQTAAPLRAAPADDLPPAMLETLGAVNLFAGENEAGRAALVKSIDRGGPQATACALLALAHHRQGRSAAARQSLESALSLSKGGPRDAELVERVRQIILRGV